MTFHYQHCFGKVFSLKTVTQIGVVSRHDYPVGLLRASRSLADSHCHLNVTWNEPSLDNSTSKGICRDRENHQSWDPTPPRAGHHGCQTSGTAMVTCIPVTTPLAHACSNDPVPLGGVRKMGMRISSHMCVIGHHSLTRQQQGRPWRQSKTVL